MDGRFAADYWRRAAELGWFSMLVPERLGGGSASGNGLMDAALIAYERGRGLQPGPFVGTNVAAYALGVAGSEAQQTTVLPGLLSGVEAVAWAAPAHGDGLGEQTGTSGSHRDGISTVRPGLLSARTARVPRGCS